MKTIIITLFLFLSLCCNAQGEDSSIQKTSATSGTVNIENNQQSVVLVQRADVLVLALTVHFPDNPSDGQTICITTKNGIASLLITADATVISPITTITASTPARWKYVAEFDEWYRI